MAGGITALDDAVREYLFFRGFVSTLKQFETERKEDRDKELNANKIVDHLLQCVERLDFIELRTFWTHLHERFFCRLNHDCRQAAYKFETSLLRLYLIHATYQGKPEEVKNFFLEMSPVLSSKKEWKDWFVLPFTKNPEANPTFRVYFTREWYQTLNTSLRNFFSTIFTYLPKPSLLNFEQEQSRLQAVAAENHHLHHQLAATKSNLAAAEQQIQQLEAKLAQKISQEAANIAIPVVKSKSKRSVQKRKVADESAVSTVGTPTTTDKRSSDDASSTAEVPSAFVDDFGEGVLTPYPVGPEGKSPFFPVSQEVYKCHNHPITHCLFSPDASKIASVDSDAMLKVWSSSSAQNTLASFQSKSPILCVDWVSPADSLLLIGCADNKIKMFDVNSQMCLWDVNADKNTKRVVSLSCSPSGSKFVYATNTPNTVGSRLSAMYLVQSWRPQDTKANTGMLAIWDMKSNSKEATLLMEAGSPAINCTTFNHNGNLLLAGGYDGIVRLFDISSQECLLSWTACPNGQVYCARFSMDETSAYTMGSDGRFVQWSINKSGKKMAEYSIHSDAYQPLHQWNETGSHATHTRDVTKANLFALEAEGHHILTAGAKQAIIYQLSSTTSDLKKALTISGHEGPVTSVDWSGLMNYSTCVTGSVDHTVRVTNLLKQYN